MVLSNSHIKNLALSEGFEICGIAKVHNLFEQKKYLSRWINSGYGATMQWLEQNMDIRLNPQLLFEGAKSVIVCAKYYNPQVEFNQNPTVAKYALDVDYHYTIRESLSRLLKQFGDSLSGECYCDSAPLLERYWAQCAGVGWQGRNGLITNTQWGSAITLGIILIDCEVDTYDTPTQNRCGNCRRCVESCPTGAILDNGRVDCNSCLSYLTIEHTSDLSVQQQDIIAKRNPRNSIFGCDICTDVCPWTCRAVEKKGYTNSADAKFVRSLEQWHEIGTNQFRKNFRITPLQRAGKRKISQTAQLLLKK